MVEIKKNYRVIILGSSSLQNFRHITVLSLWAVEHPDHELAGAVGLESRRDDDVPSVAEFESSKHFPVVDVGSRSAQLPVFAEKTRLQFSRQLSRGRLVDAKANLH